MENKEEALLAFSKKELEDYKINPDKTSDKEYLTKATAFCKQQ
jgi:hypothetical protein